MKQIVDADGNAFNVIELAKRAMQKAKVPQDEIDNYLTEAMSGDYDNLLRTTMKYMAVHSIDTGPDLRDGTKVNETNS